MSTLALRRLDIAPAEVANDDGADEQRRVDLVRIRGLALAACDAATRARDEVEAATDRLVRAREDAEQAIARCHEACEVAERVSRFASRAMCGVVDDTTLAEAAIALEALYG